MKRLICLLSTLALLLTAAACGGAGQSSVPSDDARPVVITDSEGRTVSVPRDARVVSLFGSYAEAWSLAGGSLVGATQDAIEERHLALGDDVAIVGTVKTPDLEKILALSPDLVILSEDIAAQTALVEAFDSAGIAYAVFRTDTFEAYRFMMDQFCAVTGRSDLYEKHVTAVRQRIDAILAKVPDDGENRPSVLLIRAFSTGVKAKTDDNLAGVMLNDLGCLNIAQKHPSLLEDLSIEQVIADDPDHIFILTMGNEADAIAYLNDNILSDPAWNGLTAIRENRYDVLPKELFHNKPNNRWDESYEYLAKILYPEQFGT